MIGWIGIGLTAVSALAFGSLYVGQLQSESHRIEGFLRLIRFIRGRIECFHQPLSRIYSDFSNEALNACGFLPVLRRNGFSVALAQTQDRLGLSQDMVAILGHFSSELGKSPVSEQIRHCDRTLRELEEEYARHLNTLPTRIKLARTLSAAAAAMAVILLL